MIDCSVAASTTPLTAEEIEEYRREGTKPGALGRHFHMRVLSTIDQLTRERDEARGLPPLADLLKEEIERLDHHDRSEEIEL